MTIKDWEIIYIASHLLTRARDDPDGVFPHWNVYQRLVWKLTPSGFIAWNNAATRILTQ